MSTSYEPPEEGQIIQNTMDEAATQRMLKMLEGQMTQGRQHGVPSNALDMMMYEISRTSEEIVSKRKQMVEGSNVEIEELKEEVKGETGKQRRQRLHD